MSQWSSLSATFKTEVKKKGNKPRVGVALSGIAKYYSRGKAFTMDGKSYSDELGSAPSLSLSCKMTGGLSVVNKLNINILNQNLESNHFVEGGAYPDPENAAVKAYLVFDSGTTLIADAVQFFNGIIDDFPQIDYKSLKISCTSIDKRIFHKIGDFVTDSDAPSGYKVPEDALGRMKPEIYGDHRFAVNYTKDNSQLAANYEFTRENNVIEAVPLGGGRFLIANHTCKSYDSNGDAFWFYDNDLSKLVEVNDYSVISTNPLIISVDPIEIIFTGTKGKIFSGNNNSFFDTDGGTDFTANVQAGDFIVIPLDGNDENPGTYRIKRVDDTDELTISAPYFAALSDDSNIEYTIERYPNFTDWRSPTGASSSDWANESRVHDLSIYNAATATWGTGASGTKQMSVSFELFPLPQNTIVSSRIYIKGDYTNHADFILWVGVGSDGASLFSDKTNTTQFHKHASDLNSIFLNNVTLDFVKDGGSSEAGAVSVYEIIQKVTYSKKISTDNMKIFFGGLGRPYDTWLNSRGSHQDATGDLIENAAGCVESVLRDVLGLTTTNIMNSDFDSASTDLSTSKYSFAITKQIESDKLIHDMLERVKSVGYFNYDDKFRMVVYDSGADFTEAGSNTPNDDDKFLFNPTESGNYSDNTRQFDEHPIIEDSFWIKKNPANQIVTNFELDYYQTQEGGYAKQLTSTDTTYHAEDITKKFSHPFTKDSTTAQIWLDFLVNRLNRKHWVAGWSTWYNAIGKEMWDVVNVQHPVIASLVASYATKKWRILSLDIQTDLGKISIEVEEQ